MLVVVDDECKQSQFAAVLWIPASCLIYISVWFFSYTGLENDRLDRFEVSPDGKLLVFLGQYGNMHLISAKVVMSLKQMFPL